MGRNSVTVIIVAALLGAVGLVVFKDAKKLEPGVIRGRLNLS